MDVMRLSGWKLSDATEVEAEASGGDKAAAHVRRL